MKPSDTCQIAAWICDDDDPAKIHWWRTEEVPRLVQESADHHGYVMGPITWRELQPGEENAGHPPEGIQGTNVRLLVAEAEVVGEKPRIAHKSFVGDLSHQDLERLRAATRRGVAPNVITNAECDHLIERLGPKAAERVLKDLVDRHVANEN